VSARILPNDLAAEAKATGLDVSNLTQEALRSALAANRVDEWLDDVLTGGPGSDTCTSIEIDSNCEA